MSDDKIIYHYCSADTYLKIIESKSLFLTSTKTMNDALEMEWFRRLFVNSLNNKIGEGVKKDILDLIYTNVLINTTPKYIACFSEARDSLSQWRAYADDGKGVALGFSINDMKIRQQPPATMAIDNDDRSIGLCRIVYEKTKQERHINNFMDEYIKKSEDAASSLIMSMFATIFKNPAFSEEREWRIIHSPLICADGSGKNSLVIGKISECNFRMTNFGISPYFIWDFSNHTPLPIKEVILGPQCRSDPNDIGFFLNYRGFKDVSISVSSASYMS